MIERAGLGVSCDVAKLYGDFQLTVDPVRTECHCVCDERVDEDVLHTGALMGIEGVPNPRLIAKNTHSISRRMIRLVNLTIRSRYHREKYFTVHESPREFAWSTHFDQHHISSRLQADSIESSAGGR